MAADRRSGFDPRQSPKEQKSPRKSPITVPNDATTHHSIVARGEEVLELLAKGDPFGVARAIAFVRETLAAIAVGRLVDAFDQAPAVLGEGVGGLRCAMAERTELEKNAGALPRRVAGYVIDGTHFNPKGETEAELRRSARVDLDVDTGPGALTPAQARKLAAALLRAADSVEAYQMGRR